ncbi:tether containing UBX domain for GLUT4 [Schistocerca americana]|uniref:tether containing UBX domain for GLUT4 n=1 Tax=Schistocerca americana TaxID=7009 RepID=UPI001F4F3358|nr:tether containing UBX domain for GLUT4 [Schistocerca americana]XP_046995087.1 tether containing UBX domain for GLUT4 [Schistocerca americana]
MSGGKSVIVLTPNGRRQTVKVTPNTTILQVLEEVCHKHGFQAEEYDIKHHNHVLDLTSAIRFSGLPNNAQLEMAPIAKQRKESEVTVALQSESGSRNMGSFVPTDNLWDIVQKLCPEGTDISSNPVVIYMRSEVVGVQKLRETTLRNLGITGGRAMLRLIQRAPEELQYQANVSAPLAHRSVEPVTKKAPEIAKSPPEQLKLSPKELKPHKETSKTVESAIRNVTSADMEGCVHSTDVTNVQQVTTTKIEEKKENQDIFIDSQRCTENKTKKIDRDDALKMDVPVDREAAPTTPHCADPGPEPVEEELILLGDRNAIAFNSACVQSAVYDDLPDDFFDLTVEDARILLRDIKRRRAELEDAPITTSAMRELEASKQVLNNLGRYKKSVIRIYFPDQLVLQGTFAPHETVSTVAQFVRGFLCDPELQFYLFTAPPKQVLSDDLHLVEAGLIPSAVIHFGSEKPAGDGSYLKPDIMNRLTSPNAALNIASRHRATPHVTQNRETVNTDKPSTSGTQPHHSKENPVHKSSQRAATVSSDIHPNKIPKWFKPL